MIALFLVGAVLVVCLARYLSQKKRFFELAAKLPGPPAYPIVGNALKFACESDKLFERIASILEVYGDASMMRLWLGLELLVVVTEPRDIEIILNSQQSSNKGKNYKFFYPFIGKGLISGSGNVWKAHRRLMLRILSQRILDTFVETFDRRSIELVEKLRHLANGETFDILHCIEHCTTDICCETVMGYCSAEAMANPKSEFLHYNSQMYVLVHDRMLKVWLHPDWIFRMTSSYRRQQRAKKVINEFTERCIQAKRREMVDGEVGKSILSKLLAANKETKELNDEELRDEIYTMFTASQDTMAVTSSFAVMMLGIHKCVKDKARDEVDRVLGNRRAVTCESLSRFKYVEMIIKETLRLFPIAPFLGRRLDGELRLDEHELPKDCEVIIAVYQAHRSPKYWNKPNEFIPERFDPEEVAERHPCAFLPFSGGFMGCIGKNYAMMALKVILVHILREYVITSSTNFNDIRLKTDISIRSIDGYKVSLKRLR